MSVDRRLERWRSAIEPKPWTWCWATALTLHVVRDRATRLFDAVRPLESFRGRAIGATTMQGIDASGYARGYVELVALTGVAFVIAAVLGAWIQRRLSAQRLDRLLRGELWFVELSSLFVVLTLSFSILGRWSSMVTVAWVLTGFQALTAVLAAVRVVCSRSSDPAARSAGRQLGRSPVLVHALAIGSSVGIAAWSLIAHHLDLSALLGVPAFVLFATLSGALAWRTARRLADRSERHGFRRRLARDLPLLLLPAGLVLAEEAQYRVSRFPITAVAVLVLLGIVGLVPVAAQVLDRLDGRLRLPTAQRIVWTAYAPAALFMLALVCVYRGAYVLGDLDTFHKGEQVLPTHQLFRFGVVPLIDLRLTHTLSDLVYPSLYTLFHGFRPGEHALDMLTWMTWMPTVILLPLVYWLLAAMTTRLTAVLICAATPVLSLVGSYYAMALLLALLIGRFAQRPSVRRLAAVWLGLLWLVAWRIDFGLAGALATVLVIGVRSLPAGRSAGDFRLDLRSLGRSLVPAAAVAAVVLIGLGLLSAQPLVPSLVHLLGSYTYRMATRLRAEIIPSYGMLAALQYYLLPTIAIGVVLVYVSRRLLTGRAVRSSRDPFLFLALFSLVMAVRSFTRHSLVESFNPYFFLLLLVLLPVYLVTEARAATRIRALYAVLGLLFLRLTLLLPPAGQTTGSFPIADLVPPRDGVELRAWEGDEVRYRFDASPFADALAFLDDHLEPGETFFDFTNSPALYAIADRPFPTWMIPTLAATSETFQAQMIGDIEGWYEQSRLPFVIFKQGTYWDSLEGVYPEVRSYRIAEWIYRRYRPLVRLGGYELWQDRRAEPIPIDWRTEVDLPVRERIAGPSIEVERLSRRQGVAVRTGNEDPHLYSFLRMRESPDLASRDHWTLEIEGRSSVADQIQVFYPVDTEDFRDERSGAVSAAALDPGETEVWRLALDVSEGRIADLRVDPPANAELEIHRVTLIGTTDGVQGLEDGVAQSFDLRSLPLVWEQLDPLHAAESTALLATPLDQPVLLRPGGSLSLPLDPAIDRATVGYARLRVRSARNLREAPVEDGRLYLRYDQDDCCGFAFDLAPSDDGSVDYLVRLTTQWRWSYGEIESLRLWTTIPTVLERVELRGLD